MKKTLLIGLTLLLTGSTWAQKSKIIDARDYLADKNYKKALVVINEAVNSDETKNNPEAWYLRGMAYLQQSLDSTARTPESSTESYKSLMKALAIKPDYKPEINNGLTANALIAFNEGVAAYKSNPSLAYEKFMTVVDIAKIGNGTRFANDKEFLKTANTAKQYAAYSAINAKRDDDALILLNELKNSPVKDSDVYTSLVEIYVRKNDTQNLLPLLSEARGLFPKSQYFRNQELNYYIKQGKTDVLAGKLEEAVKADPNNGELWFNLANVYEGAAFPKVNDDAKPGSTKPGPKPANYDDLFAKAENAYTNAIKANPDAADFDYNFGVLYYETATAITQQMNAIKGMTAAEQKQYDALQAQRDAQFNKAMPYFEKAYAILDPKASNLNASDKVTYINTMIGMREISSRRKNDARAAELTGKINAYKR